MDTMGALATVEKRRGMRRVARLRVYAACVVLVVLLLLVDEAAAVMLVV